MGTTSPSCSARPRCSCLSSRLLGWLPWRNILSLLCYRILFSDVLHLFMLQNICFNVLFCCICLTLFLCLSKTPDCSNKELNIQFQGRRKAWRSWQGERIHGRNLRGWSNEKREEAIRGRPPSYTAKPCSKKERKVPRIEKYKSLKAKDGQDNLS